LTETRETYLFFGNDEQVTRELGEKAAEDLLDHSDLVFVCFIGKAQKDNSGVAFLLTGYHLAETLVVRDQDTVLGPGPPQDLIVLGSAGDVFERNSVVPLITEPLSDGRPRAFVHEEPHRSEGFDRQGNKSVVFEGFAGEEEACLDVFESNIVFDSDLLGR